MRVKPAFFSHQDRHNEQTTDTSATTDAYKEPASPWPQERNYLNGMSVLGFYRDAVYVRVPREIAADCTGGCTCPYCVAHPEITPKWDTLCVDLKPRNAYGHTWTVHMPEYNPLLKGTQAGTRTGK